MTGVQTCALPISDRTLLGAISVGSSTTYRQITNVADGTQPNDAVTVRQLIGSLSSFATTTTKYFHANSTDPDSLAVGNNSIAVGPNTVVNGDNGIGMGNGALVQQNAPGGVAIGENATSNLQDSIALGTNATASGVQAISIGAGAVTANPTNVALGAGSSASAQAGDVALGANSVTSAVVATTGTTINGTSYAFAGTNPTSTVSVGSAGNERTITNVAAGRISATSTDAVNGSELYATNEALDNIISGGSGIKYFHANSSLADSSATGANSVAIGPVSTASTTNAVSIGNGATAGANAGDVALGAGSKTSAVIATSNVTVGGNTYAVAGTAPTSTVSVGTAGNERSITNVAAGQVNATSTDAVNGSELYATNQQVNANTTAINNLDNSVNNISNGGANNKYYSVDSTGNAASATGANAVSEGPSSSASGTNSTAIGSGATSSGNNSVALGAGSTDGGDSNVVSVGSATQQRQITNVAAGTAPTDAANVGQVDAAVQTAENWAQSYTNQQLANINQNLNAIAARANAGVASAMAMAGLPQAYQPNQNGAAVALGSFHGQAGIAVGLSTITESGRWVYKLNFSDNTRGDAGVSVGAAVMW